MSSEIILLRRNVMIPNSTDIGRVIGAVFFYIVGTLVLAIMARPAFYVLKPMALRLIYSPSLTQLWPLSAALLFALLLARAIYKQRQ